MLSLREAWGAIKMIDVCFKMIAWVRRLFRFDQRFHLVAQRAHDDFEAFRRD